MVVAANGFGSGCRDGRDRVGGEFYLDLRANGLIIFGAG